jgi:hypothetical protein
MKKTLVMTILIAATIPLASYAQPGDTSGGATGAGGAGVSTPSTSGGATGGASGGAGVNTPSISGASPNVGGGTTPGLNTGISIKNAAEPGGTLSTPTTTK